MTLEQAYNNLSIAIQQALSSGMFKTFEQAALAQQSLITIKNFIENGNKEKSSSESPGS